MGNFRINSRKTILEAASEAASKRPPPLVTLNKTINRGLLHANQDIK